MEKTLERACDDCRRLQRQLWRKMNVYIVWEAQDEYWGIIGVFSTQEAADAFLSKHESTYEIKYGVDVWTVDGEK